MSDLTRNTSDEESKVRVINVGLAAVYELAPSHISFESKPFGTSNPYHNETHSLGHKNEQRTPSHSGQSGPVLTTRCGWHQNRLTSPRLS
jgi:hypothetical protein